MKKWRITCLLQPNVRDGISYPRVEEEVITADYLTHEGGSIFFKKEQRHSYPLIIKIYAPGRWLEVTEV